MQGETDRYDEFQRFPSEPDANVPHIPAGHAHDA